MIKRLLVGVGAPLLLVGGAVFLWTYPSPLFCLFRAATGYLCPGCGSGRAARALLHLHVADAWRLNPLFCLALPFVATGLAAMYSAFVFHKSFPLPNLPAWLGWGILGAVICFWIGRNLI